MQLKYEINSSKFKSIPGWQFGYWYSVSFLNNYSANRLVGDMSMVSEGVKTGNNDRFLRLWYEIDGTKFSFSRNVSKSKWFPHHKGGLFRKWYGNLEYVINWENNGIEIKSSDNFGLQGRSMYFKEYVGWSKICSGNYSFRYFKTGTLFDSAAPSIMNKMPIYTLALLNCVVGKAYLSINPTLNLQVGDVKKIPFIYSKSDSQSITDLSEESIFNEKEDWDSFETSWDFKKHPLI